ncbi:helix-turn-helix domain-containing protein [Sphingopyxis chilensis]|uniref:helix-turn-helix domain-containing protein n=1 Tax=Sphingopyxis chilensis TaxID=180400 RepID=UPI002DDD1527|nr:helix-turn-helix domain-containing protein [Sphingopyxis chilensis]
MGRSDDDGPAERAAKARAGSPFLSAAETAHYLGISERTLLEYRSKGRGPAFRRHGNKVRYHIDDLIAWSQRLRRAGDDA